MVNISNLPFDIVRDNIIPFTYSPQPADLLRDINSYNTTMMQIKELYCRKFSEYNIDDDDGPLSWLSNDICRFMNNDIPTMHGIIDSYKKTFQRLYVNNSKNLSEIIVPSMMCNSFSDIKVTVGLLTIEERTKLKVFLGVDAVS